MKVACAIDAAWIWKKNEDEDIKSSKSRRISRDSVVDYDRKNALHSYLSRVVTSKNDISALALLVASLNPGTIVDNIEDNLLIHWGEVRGQLKFLPAEEVFTPSTPHQENEALRDLFQRLENHGFPVSWTTFSTFPRIERIYMVIYYLPSISKAIREFVKKSVGPIPEIRVPFVQLAVEQLWLPFFNSANMKNCPEEYFMSIPQLLVHNSKKIGELARIFTKRVVPSMLNGGFLPAGSNGGEEALEWDTSAVQQVGLKIDTLYEGENVDLYSLGVGSCKEMLELIHMNKNVNVKAVEYNENFGDYYVRLHRNLYEFGGHKLAARMDVGLGNALLATISATQNIVGFITSGMYVDSFTTKL